MRVLSLFLVSALALTSANLSAESGRRESTERLQLASDTLKAMIDTPDKGIPEEVLGNAKCIVVIPHLVKGGFVLGAEHGRGVATCRTSDGWSAPAFVSIGGGSWGLQIGVEGVDLVMLVMNDNGLQHMLSSKFKIGADASASAGPVGRHASAGTDWKMDAEILTYSRSKGAFAGISLDGAVLQQDEDSTRAIYRSKPSIRATLSGQVHAPESTLAFIHAVSSAAHVSAVADAE
jgi:lipid-binding SYLF domain-containing protein